MKKWFILLVFILVSSSSFTAISLDDYSSDSKNVEIKGEVNKPGIYSVAQNATVFDVIQAAGGVSKLANLDGLNQNKNLINNEVIVIPEIIEKVYVSINSATLEELDGLKGIGPKTAQRIIDYRRNKPFSQLEDIMLVKGIKTGLFMKIKADICL